MQKEGCNFLSNGSLFRWHCDIRSCSGCVCFSPIVAEGGVDFLWRLEAVNLCHLWAFPLGSMILTHWPRWLPRKRITTKTIKTSNLELAHVFCKSLMIWKPQEGNLLHSIFVTGFYVSVPALGLCYSYFGWLTGKTAWGKFVFFLFSQSTEDFGKVDTLPKAKSSHLNISRNPKGPKDPTSQHLPV